MKKLMLFAIALFLCPSLKAQERAITGTGAEVILFMDGTWEYANVEDKERKEIPVNEKKFKKDDKSTFLLKSTILELGVWLNPKIWNFTKEVDNPDAEYELQIKGGDLYGIMITEKVEIPLESMRDIALDNARRVAPDVKVINEEYRTVNGLRVLQLQMKGTTQGIKFSYYCYYYSDENGTLQFLTYTSQKLMEENKEEVENLLNGLVLVD